VGKEKMGGNRESLLTNVGARAILRKIRQILRRARVEGTCSRDFYRKGSKGKKGAHGQTGGKTRKRGKTCAWVEKVELVVAIPSPSGRRLQLSSKKAEEENYQRTSLGC